jgi:hypothetical protein
MENYEISMPPPVAPFAMVHGPVIVDPTLNDSAVRLYCLLWCLGDRFKKGWHSQALLARLLHVTDRTIRNGLTNLIKAGLIETTVRRPRPTLIKVVDPADIYGEFMVQFYNHVKNESAGLRLEAEETRSNRKNSSGSIGSILPTKDIKGSRGNSADFRPRTSVEDSIKGVEKKQKDAPPRKKPTPRRKDPGLRIPTMKPLSSSRWGGPKFYLYCIYCAGIKKVPVRDPDAHAQRVAPRFASEMKRAIGAYQDMGYTRKKFCDLLTLIFDNWRSFSQFFVKEKFSVYDLRYSINSICEMDRRLRGKQSLTDTGDKKEDQESPEEFRGKIVYLDEEEE